MKGHSWSVLAAMKYGVVFGVLFAIARIIVEGGAAGFLSTETLARLVGGAIGGAVLFGIVTTVRNMLNP